MIGLNPFRDPVIPVGELKLAAVLRVNSGNREMKQTGSCGSGLLVFAVNCREGMSLYVFTHNTEYLKTSVD